MPDARQDMTITTTFVCKPTVGMGTVHKSPRVFTVYGFLPITANVFCPECGSWLFVSEYRTGD